MRWYEHELRDRHGRIRAVVRPLGAVWEVVVPNREIIRAATEQAGRVLAEGMVRPPVVVREGDG